MGSDQPGVAVRGAPLYVEGWTFTAGPHAGETHDLIVIATSDNLVYAYAEDQLLADPTAGPLWGGNPTAGQPGYLGTPSSSLGSNIPIPIGVCSTPLVDRASARVFAMALISGAPDTYSIFSLDLNTGAILAQAQLNDTSTTAPHPFTSSAQDQRGALNLVNGWIYATFADFLAFDLGPYRGWLVACNPNNLSQQLFLPLVSQTVNGGGAWGPGGAAAASDGTLYVSTGNATNEPANYWTNHPHPGDNDDYFEGVVQVVQLGGPTLDVLHYYQPTWAETLDAGDLDFGGSSPIVLPPIGGSQLVVTTAKDGNVYLLPRTLPGWGGELWSSARTGPDPTHGAFGDESKCCPAYFHDPIGGKDYVYVVGGQNPGLIAYSVDVSGATPVLTPAWDAGMTFGDGPGSPFVVMDPSTMKGLVWVVDGPSVSGTVTSTRYPNATSNTALPYNKDHARSLQNPVLYAFEATSGAVVYRSDRVSTDAIDYCPNFPPVMGTGKSILVGTDSGIVGYVAVARALGFIIDRSTYGRDEILAMQGNPPGPANFNPAFWVTVDGFTPSDLGVTKLTSDPNPANRPTPANLMAWAPSVPSPGYGMVITPVGVDSDAPSLPNQVQRFTFTYEVTFNDVTGFNTITAAGQPVTLTASLTADATPVQAQALVELIVEPDPFFSSGEVSWLSADLRVYSVAQGDPNPKFGVPLTDPNTYIKGVIDALRMGGGAAGGDTFDGLTPDEEASAVEFLPTNSSGAAVYNFALAKVHFRSLMNDATLVRVFFRTFPAATTSTAYEAGTGAPPGPPGGVFPAAGTYRAWTDGTMYGTKIPLLGIEGGEYVTVPYFADPRVQRVDATQPMTVQTDTKNAVPIDHDSTGSEVETYFGCWLDLNQTTLLFPQIPPATNVDGPFTGSLQSIPDMIIRSPHQCLIAEISFDPVAIPNGVGPGATDKIAQRNLAWVDGPNPGISDSRRIPQTFEIRQGAGAAGQPPDELMIEWGNVPKGSVATIYLPTVDADRVLALAARMYATRRLKKVAANTLQCDTGGTLYLPIPPGGSAKHAGLLTVDLPATVRKGDLYKVVVRQVTGGGFTKTTGNQTSARRGGNVAVRRPSRRALGAFQLNIPISTKEALLVQEERKLSWLKWILHEMWTHSRWYPIFLHYVALIGGRVGGMGGNPGSIPPSPTGTWKGGPGTPGKGEEPEIEWTGKVASLVYDHFGDFEGFFLETERGEMHRFRSIEGELEALVRHVWQDRIVISVATNRRHPHRVLRIFLRRPPRHPTR
jgi:hypothetical protein